MYKLFLIPNPMLKGIFSSRIRAWVLLGAFMIVFAGSAAMAAIISGASSVASSSQVTYTQLTVGAPTSTVAGNLLLANIAVNGGSSAVVTKPTGWNEISRTDNDVNVSLISYWKAATAADIGASYTWTIDSQTQAKGGITAYSGVSTSNPIDSFATSTGLGTTATAPSIVTTAANEMTVALFATEFGKNENTQYFGPVTGMTQRYNSPNIPFGPSIAAFDALQAAAGTVSARVSDIQGGKVRNWAAQQISLKNVPAFPSIMESLNLTKRRIDGNDVSYSGTYTVPSGGTDKLLVVIVAVNNINVTPIMSQNGSPLTVIEIPGTANRAKYWVGYLAAPTSGTFSLSYDIQMPPYNQATFYMMTLQNAAQSNPIDDSAVTNNSATASKTTSVTTTVANDLLLSLSYFASDPGTNQAVTTSYGSGETEYAFDRNLDHLGPHVGALRGAPSAGSNSMTTTWSATGDVDQVVIAVKPN